MRTLSQISFLFLLLCVSLNAAPGDVDESFSPNLYTSFYGGEVSGIAVKNNGNILVGGPAFSQETYGAYELIEEVLPEGELSKSFDAPYINQRSKIIAQLWDGKILVAGTIAGTTLTDYKGVQRLNADGSIDPTFSAQITGGGVSALALQSDNKILIGGDFAAVNGISRPRLARLNEDGSLDESFSPDVNDVVYTLALQDDQQILVGGKFTELNGESRQALARLNVDGSLDLSFISNITITPSLGYIYCIISHHEGDITVGGAFNLLNKIGSYGLVSLSSNGDFIRSPSPPYSASIRSMALQADGKMIVGSGIVNYPPKNVIRLHKNGDYDSGFVSPNLSATSSLGAYIYGIALQKNGQILIGTSWYNGSTANQSTVSRKLLHRLNNDPATDSLLVTDSSRIEWLRGGSTPEALAVRFEFSEDGVNWQMLGQGSRIDNGWELDDLSLPNHGYVRARARTCGGYRNACYGIVETMTSIGVDQPQIVLEDPDGTEHTDDLGSYDYGNDYTVRTFKIRNTGSALLRLDSINISNILNCKITVDTNAMARVLAPEEETTFTVFMDPLVYSQNTMRGVMTIVSNAEDNTELVFSLLGKMTGRSPTFGINHMSVFRTEKDGIGDQWLQFTQPFVPNREKYYLRIPSDLTSATLYFEMLRNPGGFSRIRYNGQEIGDSYLNLSFELNPQPIVLEICSLDGENWITYTINVLRSPPVAGDLDLLFSSEQEVSLPYAINLAIQPDGKILLGNGRLNSDGTIDGEFHPNGGLPQVQILPDLNLITGRSKLLPSGDVIWQRSGLGYTGFDALGDGGILLNGSFNNTLGANYPTRGLLKILSSGDLDLSYQSPVFGWVNSALEDSEGKLLICGVLSIRSSHGQSFKVARLLQNGALDESFHSVKVDNEIVGLFQQPDGKVLIYGSFSKVDDQFRQRIARLNRDGTLDDTFVSPSNTSSEILSLALQADGKIIFEKREGNLRLGRLNSNGTSDNTFQVYGSLGGIVLQKNGQILIQGGSNYYVNNVLIHGLARIHNDPATESLTVPDASSILWLRGGSAPEARRVYFECSANGGESWTNLGLAHYISGGWELTGLSLPPNGTIRARAVIQSGPYNRSSGIVESLADFSFPPAAMALETTEGQTWVSGEDCDFGSVGLGGMSRCSFTLKNTGETQLRGISLQIEGADAGDFRLLNPLISSLPKAGEQTLSFLFNPTKLGHKQAVAMIYNETAGDVPVEIHLLGSGIKGNSPQVKSLPANTVLATSVIMNGTVNPKGFPHDVFFEYGLTKDLGTVIEANPTHVEGTQGLAVHAEVTGLLPNTRYFYRVRAAGQVGGAVGTILNFITGNHAPVARPDTLSLFRGPSLYLDVLANDEDADGDSLTIASFSSVEPAGVGTLTRIGNALLFVYGEASGYPTFTYQVKDSRGALSEPAQVIIKPISGDLLGVTSELIQAQGKTFIFGLMVYGASWKVEGLPSWIKLNATEGFGDFLFNVTVLPNPSTKPRTSQIKIGYLSYDVTQSGVMLPELSLPALPLPPAQVGADYTLEIPTLNLPVIYQVKNLPPGLSINGDTGLITGIPTKAGTYSLTINARNAAGKAPEAISFDLVVEALPDAFIGRFQGIISVDEMAEHLGGRFEILTTSSGSFSGKVTLGTKAESFKGVISVEGSNPTEFSATASLPGKTAVRTVNLSYSQEDTPKMHLELLSDDVVTHQGSGWGIPWNGKTQLATAFAETYSFRLSPSESEAAQPQGYGFGTFTIAERTGAVKVSGRAADGSAFVCSSLLSESGEVMIYQSLYKQRGSLTGKLSITAAESTSANSLSGQVSWIKLPTVGKGKDLIYREGFGPVTLTAAGGTLPTLESGTVIMNLTGGEEGNAELKLDAGGLDEPKQVAVTVSNPSAKGTKNLVKVEANDIQLAFSRLDTKKGSFNGSFTLTGPSARLNRKSNFLGQLVRVGVEIRGYGYFLLSDLPGEGETLKSSPIQSGAVLFQPKPVP